MMPTPKTLFTVLIASGLTGGLAGTALAAEDAASFARVKGGAVFDYRTGVDGADVSEEYLLIHVVCSDGSKKVRVMLPASPEDDGAVFDGNGPASTLKKHGDGYEVTFRMGGSQVRKNLVVKPVNDAKSNYDRQFMVTLTYGEPLWKALLSDKDDAVRMLIGEGGMPVWVPDDPALHKALASCGLPG